MRSRTVLSWLSLLLALMFATTAFAAENGRSSDSGDPPDLDEYLTPGVLSIDGQYYQEGMNAPYKDGYSPTVQDGMLDVVLPLLAAQEIDGNTLYCDLDLGNASTSPFRYTNYDSIPLGLRYSDENSEDYNPELYVANFELPLKTDRENGVYALGVTIRYRVNGKNASQVFHIDFTVADAQDAPEPSSSVEPTDDGGDGDTGYDDGSSGGDIDISGGDISGGGNSGASEPTVGPEPKVILENYAAQPSPCDAGETFTVTCTLRNTSKTSSVRNMTVTFKSQTTDLIPSSGTSTAYIESIAKNATAQFAFTMRAAETAASGPQKIDISLGYEGQNGTAYTATDEITVLVQQRIRLEWDQPQFPTSVFIGDTMNATLNLYNKGKSTLYNVSVALDVPGLSPESSAFLGNMESGASKSADIYASVTGIQEDISFEEVEPESSESSAAGTADSTSAADAADAGMTREADTSADMPLVANAEAVAADEGPEQIVVGGEEGTEQITEGEIQEDMGGETSGNFVISYEDEFGATYERKVPVSTFIETIPMDMGGMEEPMEPLEPEPTGFPWWGWALIGGGGAGVAIPVAVHNRKKKRLAELNEDDDELY